MEVVNNILYFFFIFVYTNNIFKGYFCLLLLSILAIFLDLPLSILSICNKIVDFIKLVFHKRIFLSFRKLCFI